MRTRAVVRLVQFGREQLRERSRLTTDNECGERLAARARSATVSDDKRRIQRRAVFHTAVFNTAFSFQEALLRCAQYPECARCLTAQIHLDALTPEWAGVDLAANAPGRTGGRRSYRGFIRGFIRGSVGDLSIKSRRP
eukprot:7003299-Pyramimonas_sp.AAC.1